MLGYTYIHTYTDISVIAIAIVERALDSCSRRHDTRQVSTKEKIRKANTSSHVNPPPPTGFFVLAPYVSSAVIVLCAHVIKLAFVWPVHSQYPDAPSGTTEEHLKSFHGSRGPRGLQSPVWRQPRHPIWHNMCTQCQCKPCRHVRPHNTNTQS